ncbi:MAG: cell division protein ZapA, partial [Bacteroidetes bacterium]|nr:cell division protein ZapA [Bacteroidota bacterium]
PINIVLGDRTYRIKISPLDEQEVRKVLKAINDKIIEFKTQFSGKDMQDYVAMVLLWYATQAPPSLRPQPELHANLQNALSKIELQLDKVLQFRVQG